MQELFTILSHAVEGTAIIAISASFVWGILTKKKRLTLC